MLRSLNEIYGNRLAATDGEIGHVRDFYFEDRTWVTRYLVADTGSWLPGRQVLLSPHSIGRLDQVDKLLHVKLTRAQIENSPSIATRKPVSRQYEEDYYRHHGLPTYWQGSGLWGQGDFPILDTSPDRPDIELDAVTGLPWKRPEAHLRSTRAVQGYLLVGTDGTLGHVCDFMIDAHSWAIGQLAIKTGHRLSGEEMLIPTKVVDQVSYEDSTIFVKLTLEAMGKHPARDFPATLLVP